MVSEDALGVAGGALAVFDVDAGEAAAQPYAAATGLGTFAVSADGTWTYDLDNAAVQSLAGGATLAQRFTVRSQDGTASQVVTVTITGENDAPVVLAAMADQEAVGDQAWSFQLPAGSFSDVDSAGLTYSATLADGSALPDWLSFDAATRSFAGTPPRSFGGVVALKVTASDGELSASDSFDLVVQPGNAVATISGDLLRRAGEDDASAVTGTVVVLDADAGEAVARAASGTTALGSLYSVTADGTWSYTLNTAAVQYLVDKAQISDSFVVTSLDGSATETVVIDIVGSNDAPQLTAPIADLEVDEDTAWQFTVPAGTFIDVEGQALTYSATLADGSDLPG